MAALYDFRAAREALVAEFGRDAIARLHRQSAFLDWLAIVSLWALFGGLIYLLGTLPIGVAWAACALLQGFVVMAFGYLLHDLFVHRRVGGRWFSRWMGAVCGALANQLSTPYAETHHDHHGHTGVEVDEAYKEDLDTRWKRWFFLTPAGYLIALQRGLRGKRAYEVPGPPGAFGKILDEPTIREFRRDRWIWRLLWLVLIASAFFWPRFVLLGYVVPLFVVLPLANAVRLVLEHAETNPGNPYHCATYYRTGFFTRVLFFGDAGDCHLVHHVFPLIPFYRMGEAVDLTRPFFLRHGVRERRSLATLIYGYFIRNELHRSLWSS